LRDKRVEMDLKEPWNLLYFSDDSLKKTSSVSVRSTPENFCEKLPSCGWSSVLDNVLTPS
jgi:hypothetical protein